MLSIDSQQSQPRTPRTGRSPNPSQVYFTPSRKSTDSWNSSNADEAEWEWKPDQILLLSRTLDALPAHLVTPFNGPIPPPNLLDKIARGVSTAKGPEEWPHSLRATRVKLIELARTKAKSDGSRCDSDDIITEELLEEDAPSSYSYIHDGAERPLARRKPSRQSSMDFIDTAGQDIKNNPDIARLSRRLQRSERASFHPYSRGTNTTTRRSASPPPPAAVPALVNSESSDTLSSDSVSSASQQHRRSISSLSSISMKSCSSLPDPRVQRIRMSESSAAPVVASSSPKVGVKRAPSYGALLQNVKMEKDEKPKEERRDSGSYPSSDEEEKARTKNAKKPRVKSTTAKTKSREVSPVPPPVPEKDVAAVVVPTKKKKQAAAPAPVEPELDIAQLLASPPPSSFNKKKMAKVESALGSSTPPTTTTTNKKAASTKRVPMNLQRNPSMFGPELPVLEPTPEDAPAVQAVPMPTTSSGAVTPPRSPVPKPRARTYSILARAPALSPGILSPASALACAMSPTAHLVAPDTPASPDPSESVGGGRVKKTLKRVRRLVPGRRISFGMGPRAVSEECEEAGEGEGGTCLGSAFQLL